MDTGDRTVYLAEVLDARIERAATPLTFKRLLELAPADKLREMKLAMERDMELDRADLAGGGHATIGEAATRGRDG